MNNTKRSFEDKWDKNRDLAFRETLKKGSDIQTWILHRNGWENLEAFENFLEDKRRILDAGCGNGRVTALLREHSHPDRTEVVGFDIIPPEVATNNLGTYSNLKIYQRDLLGNFSDLGKFDFVYSQEVLHHTDDPFRAFKNLVDQSLAPKGTIAIYVYKKKAPIREFTDDYIRNAIRNLSYEDAMRVTDQITEFGKALSESKVTVHVPRVDALRIEEGDYEVQRMIYHFFMKCFWNPSFSFHDNSVINYDWYHPQNCFRYDVEEIREWFRKAGLSVTHEYVDHYGITMHGTPGQT